MTPSSVSVLLDRVTPAAPGPDDTLSIAGRVRNTGTSPLREVEVRLLTRRSPLALRGDVARRTSVDAETGDLDLVPDVGIELPDVPAGATERFTLTMPLAELDLGEFGVYPLAVQALSTGAPAATLPTVLPWMPEDAEPSPTSLAWLWPAPARFGPDGTVEEDLAAALAPGGRLDSLVRAARTSKQANAAVLLDPLLLEMAASLRQADQTTATPSPAASSSPPPPDPAWLTALRSGPSYLLPYGDPDLMALHRAGQLEAVHAAVERAQRVARMAGLDDTPLAWPVGGAATAAAARSVAPLVRAVLLADEAMPPQEAPAYTPAGRATLTTPAGPADVLLADTVLSELAAVRPVEDDPARTPGALRQAFLAETAMITAERPAVSRTVLVAPARGWDPDPALAAELLGLAGEVPWLRPTAPSEMLATAAPDLPRSAPVYPSAARAAELPTAYLRDVAALERSSRTVSSVLADPAAEYDRAAASAAELRSAALRPALRDGAPARAPVAYARQRADLLAEARREVERRRERVRIVPASVTLGARQGPVPVTVINRTDQAVTVRVQLTPQLPRLVLTESPEVSIPAGRRAQVNVPATAVANGPVTVDARLLTGDEVYAEPVPIPVRVTTVDQLGTYLTLGAGILLIVGLVLRTVRRRRARRTDTVSGPAGAPDDVVVAQDGAAAPGAPPPPAVPDPAAHPPEGEGSR